MALPPQKSIADRAHAAAAVGWGSVGNDLDAVDRRAARADFRRRRHGLEREAAGRRSD